MTPPPRQLLTNALVALLRSQAGWQVHDHPGTIDAPKYPYLAVFSIAGGQLSGPPLTAPDADGAFVYQLDAVGTRRDQAELQADKAAAVVLGRRADGGFVLDFEEIPGFVVSDRMPTDTTPGGVEVIPARPTLYRDTRRYTIAMTPQGT